jgi:Ca2+-binding EF-hand superfamily protein
MESTTSVPTNEECHALWTRMDNGNGILSLAELDKGVIELWPNLNHKPAIMRAYKAADRNGDGFIKKNEFCFFLKFIHYYNDLWKLFDQLDESGDRRHAACRNVRTDYIIVSDEYLLQSYLDRHMGH